jgi:N-acetylneuraminate synthase
MFGPDISASITLRELELVCNMRNALAVMDAHPVDKDNLAHTLKDMRKMFGRSLAPARLLTAGTVLEPEMLTLKKPEGGIPPESMQEIAGRQLARDVCPSRILRWTDLEEDLA